MTEADPSSEASVGERLRLTRRALNLKQTELCRLIGIPDQAWNNAETGDNFLTVMNAVKLCQVTGVTMDWIYRGNIIGLPHDVLKSIIREQARAKKVSKP